MKEILTALQKTQKFRNYEMATEKNVKKKI